jgi:hypothetical protein
MCAVRGTTVVIIASESLNALVITFLCTARAIDSREAKKMSLFNAPERYIYVNQGIYKF